MLEATHSRLKPLCCNPFCLLMWKCNRVIDLFL